MTKQSYHHHHHKHCCQQQHHHDLVSPRLTAQYAKQQREGGGEGNVSSSSYVLSYMGKLNMNMDMVLRMIMKMVF